MNLNESRGAIYFISVALNNHLRLLQG